MKKHILILFLICGLCCLTASMRHGLVEAQGEGGEEGAPEEAESEVAFGATISELDGDVEVKRPGETEMVEAVKDMRLEKGTEVSTGFESFALLEFDGNDAEEKSSRVRVEQLSQMVVNDFAKSGESYKTRLKLRIGTVGADVNDNIDSDFSISTPTMTASVRGTEIGFVKYSPDFGSSVLVVDHVVDATSGGRTMSLDPGESTNDDLIAPPEVKSQQASTPQAPIGSTLIEQQLSTEVGGVPNGGDLEGGIAGNVSGGGKAESNQGEEQNNTTTTNNDLPAPPSTP